MSHGEFTTKRQLTTGILSILCEPRHPLLMCSLSSRFDCLITRFTEEEKAGRPIYPVGEDYDCKLSDRNPFGAHSPNPCNLCYLDCNPFNCRSLQRTRHALYSDAHSVADSLGCSNDLRSFLVHVEHVGHHCLLLPLCSHTVHRQPIIGLLFASSAAQGRETGEEGLAFLQQRP